MSDDPEKNVLSPSTADPKSLAQVEEDANPALRKASGLLQRWRRLEDRMTKYNLEPRGIQRVLPEERQPIEKLGYLHIIVFWFSANLAANNLTLGMLGPAVYYLPFTDACLCGVFGALAGSAGAAYIASFGPRSGHRGLVFARYIMGWWPGKLAVILALVNLLGYCIINAVIAGQILSAVSSPTGSLSVTVGIVIVAIICWAISTFGYSVFHLWERYAWIPQLIAYSILAGVAGPSFSLTTSPDPTVSPLTLAGNRLSFFSLCFSAAVTYSSNSPDYFVYYPPTTSRVTFILCVLTGLTASFSMTFILGIGLTSALTTNTAYADAYQLSQGALLTTSLTPLGGFGAFISVLIALGLISNLVPTTYSAGLNFQVLGRLTSPLPRVFLNTLAVVIWMVCAIAGRERLAEIFTNFLALVGYWFTIYVAIVIEEEVLFKWRRGDKWDWEGWEDRTRLPVGGAALVAFLVGYAGAVLCMTQVWFIGPIARAAFGEYGGDLGNYVGVAWTLLVYPPLRWWEIRKFGR